MSLKPWDITKLAVGPVRVLLAPTSEAVPTSLQDVIDLVSPYDPAGDWFDLGAARESSTYTRGMDEEGLQIQQESGDIMTEITDISRSLKLSIAEIAPENIGIIENSVVTEAVAAAANTSAQTAVPIGSFSDLENYRAAMIAVRKKQSGVVTEPGAGALERGRLVAVVLNRVTLAAEDADLEWDKGQLTQAGLTLNSFPEPGSDDAESYGRWFFEAAGVIA
jgi:hypothetical protein